MKTIWDWMRQPCSHWQIAFCVVMFLSSGAFLEYKNVDRGFNLLYMSLGTTVCVGMLATKHKWRLLNFICTIGLLISGGWLGTWLYLHLNR